ncbi:hypothetical protein PROFUN_12875 [Planoprotostelium fungivorum]|uniref:Uncharacterized protein n=1 Tax=Planoprotostelium fungivorum TaxID=1890364 RepID=A0A2P6N6E5_9EUKA|nr:hypothetical protein PROFUN_12875 [Planoprotostelium fungivorum]
MPQECNIESEGVFVLASIETDRTFDRQKPLKEEDVIQVYDQLADIQQKAGKSQTRGFNSPVVYRQDKKATDVICCRVGTDHQFKVWHHQSICWNTIEVHQYLQLHCLQLSQLSFQYLSRNLQGLDMRKFGFRICYSPQSDDTRVSFVIMMSRLHLDILRILSAQAARERSWRRCNATKTHSTIGMRETVAPLA